MSEQNSSVSRRQAGYDELGRKVPSYSSASILVVNSKRPSDAGNGFFAIQINADLVTSQVCFLSLHLGISA